MPVLPCVKRPSEAAARRMLVSAPTGGAPLCCHPMPELYAEHKEWLKEFC
jgi:hypothetical protein